MDNTYQLTLLVNERCNLRCAYCNCDTSTHPIVMSIRQAIDEIEAIRHRHQHLDLLKILLMGGEPMMEYEFIQELVAYTRTITDFPIQIKAVTNGVLVDKSKQTWLTANRDILQLSLSIDGNKESHNRNRCNSFDRIDLHFFAETYPQTAVSCTISPNTLDDLAENIIFLHSQGFNVKAVLADGVDWPINSDTILYEQLSKLTDYYIEHAEQRPFNMLSNALWLIKREYSIDRCRPYQTMHCIDAKGKSYACHRCSDYWNQGTWKIPADQLSLKEDLYLKEECRSCVYQKFCNSCPASVAANRMHSEAVESICRNNKAMYIANAEMALKIFLQNPEHAYFKHQTSKQMQDLLEVALQLINNQ